MKTRTIIFLFIPAILVALFVLFIRITQYKPLYPSDEDIAKRDNKTIQIPILPEDVILGNKKAGKTVVVFEDFGCPGCAAQMDLLRLLVERHPNDVKIIWKALPISRVPFSSELAHQYGYCAHKQNKFDVFEKLAFDNQSDLSQTVVQELGRLAELDEQKLEACLTSPQMTAYFENTKIIARALNVQSVPSVFIDNKQIQPPQRVAGWETLLGL